MSPDLIVEDGRGLEDADGQAATNGGAGSAPGTAAQDAARGLPKTLHITNAFHATSGGIRTFYRALLARANADGRLMRLVVPAERDGVEDVGRFGRIYHVGTGRAPAFDRRYRILWPTSYLPPGSGAVAAILRRERPDLVEICDKYSLPYLAALLRKGFLAGVPRPVLVGLSCERMDDNVSAYLHDGAAARHLTALYIRHVYGPPFDYHVANSAYTAGELQQALADRPAGFIRTAPMGVDAAAFGPSRRDPSLRRALLERAGGTDASVLVFYAGRLAPEKHVTALVDMTAHLAAGRDPDRTRDFRLVVAGDGPLAHELGAMAAERAPGRVLFLGPVSDGAHLAACYASADVFVHPNPREPFGIGPLEAMASGVPVVVPAAGGVLSYASMENAWLATPGGRGLAAAVTRAARERDPARLFNARRTACTHDWPRVAAMWFAMYDRLAGA